MWLIARARIARRRAALADLSARLNLSYCREPLEGQLAPFGELPLLMQGDRPLQRIVTRHGGLASRG